MKRITLLVVAILFVGSMSARADEFGFGLFLNSPDPYSVSILGAEINARYGIPIDGQLEYMYPDGVFSVNALGGGNVTVLPPTTSPKCAGDCEQVVTFGDVPLTITAYGGFPQDPSLSGVIVTGLLSGSDTEISDGNPSTFGDSFTSVSGTFSITSVSPQFLAAEGVQAVPTSWSGSGTLSGYVGCEMARCQGDLTVNFEGAATLTDLAPEPGTFVLFGLGLSVLGMVLLRSRRSRHQPVV